MRNRNIAEYQKPCLMVGALMSGSRGLVLSPGQGYHVVFVGKMLYSHSASLHQGVYQMSTSEFNSGG